MTWSRFDDGYAEDPRWDVVGMDGLGLTVAAIGYSNHNLTDGHLTRSRACRLSALADPHAVIDRLVAAGIWQDLGGDNLRVVFGLEWQFTKEKTLAHREDERVRIAGLRAKAAAKREAHTPTRTEVQKGVRTGEVRPVYETPNRPGHKAGVGSTGDPAPERGSPSTREPETQVTIPKWADPGPRPKLTVTHHVTP